MKTSVNFQAPFSYSIGIIIALIVLLFFIVILAVVLNYKKVKKQQEKPKEIVRPKNISEIKKEYLAKLDELANSLNTISNRKAYQNLSILIRSFVYEVTKIKVQKCTLKEIKQYNLPVLTELVEEYYAPEFSKYEKGAITSSIDKTRKAIEKWS